MAAEPAALPVERPFANLKKVYITGEPEPELPVTFSEEPNLSRSSPMSNNVDKILNALFRDDEKRLQLWPEKLLRAGATAAGDVAAGKVPLWAIDNETGDVHTSPQMIEKAQEISALAGSGGLANPAKGATLNATPSLRPALKHNEKLYKGKPGQEHQDIIPDTLYNDFQKKAMRGDDLAEYNFGFVNDKGHFLSREDALKYGIDNGLIDPQAGKFGALTSTLMADSSKPGTAIEAMAKTADPFFSALEHNVKGINQAKMNGDAWLGTLSNKPGVKPEELDWTGLKSFLEENKGKPVTKAQIEEHLASNKVELKEVSKGELKFDKNNEYALPEVVKAAKQAGDTPGDLELTLANDGKAYEALMKKFPKLREDEDWAATVSKAVFGGDSIPTGTTKYHSYQLPGGPLSRDTEILTNKGWKRIDAVEIGDVVMTRKDEAGILEWQPVQATPRVYAENLYHFFSQSINMRVTENHQMIAKKRRRSGNNELQRLTAKELWGKSEMLVPLTGVWNGGETDKIFGFDPHDLAELFGWYLAEGSYKREGEVKNTIQISQCREYNPEKCDRIEALLNRMGIAWKYYGEAYGIGVKTLNKDLVALFHEQPTSEFKFVPYFFFEQSKSVIHSLLDGLILGDGCTSEQEGRLDKTTFFTKSEQLAGDVQILILMIGKNANVRQRPSGLYCVGIKSKEWSSVDDAKFEIAPYNDFAFCVTVENHAIYVRRNGVAAFTGNSNYREKLLTLPTKRKQIGVSEGEFGGMPIVEQTPSQPFKSSHWDEPNIIAHVRMNDRTIDGKKALHLEEIQSDWHQQGRDKGYRPEQEKKLAGLVEQREALQKEASTLGASDARYKEIYKELPTIQTKINEIGSSNVGVPDAPFKKSWHELALKRMIREASENGYDRLSWTAGEHHPTNPKNLKQTGEAAEKADKGMQGFYNDIIPKIVEKLGKEHGVKVKSTEIDSTRRDAMGRKSGDSKKSKIYYIDIPQSLRNTATQKGFPLFSKGGYMLMPVDYEPEFKK